MPRNPWTRLDHHFAWLTAGAIAAYWVGASALAITKPMWLDELATYYPANLPSWAQLWDFFASGREVHTPVSAILMRLSLALLGDTHWAIRVPYMLGYFLLLCGAFLITARRTGPSWGFLAAALPLVASTVEYAVEARPYALTMGLCAIAAWAWQSLEPSARPLGWRLLLTASFGLAVSLHFFAVFFLIPLAVGELLRWRRTGRRSWLNAGAVLLSPLAFLPFLPGVLAGRALYSGTYWSRPQLSSMEESYRFLLTLSFFPLLAGLLVWTIVRPWIGERNSSLPEREIPSEEWGLVGCWCLLPVFMVAGAFFLGAYVTRYALPSMGGLAVLLAWLCWRATRGDRSLSWLLSLLFVAWFSYKSLTLARQQWQQAGGRVQSGVNAFATRRWYPVVEASGLPLAITPAVLFVQTQHYSSPPLRQRIFYPLDPSLARRWDGTDTGDLWLGAVARLARLQTPSYAEFSRTHSKFLLLANLGVPTWHIQQLRQDGATLRLLENDASFVLFEVSTSPAAPSPGNERGNSVIPDRPNH